MGTIADWLELTKLRLSLLVVSTGCLGFILGSETHIMWVDFMFCSLGIGLCAGSASVFNQLFEKNKDVLMNRTQNRPIPAGRIGMKIAWTSGFILGWFGLFVLSIKNGLIPASLALATIIIYALLYTPMKPISNLNTLIGALVGALPPMIGWSAANGKINFPCVVLALILFFWQLPHFLALSWIYRDEYKKAGFQMLGANKDDELSGRICVMGVLFLIPLCLFLFTKGPLSLLYAILSVALNIFYLIPAWRFFKNRNNMMARNLFRSSLLYLPVLIFIIILDLFI